MAINVLTTLEYLGPYSNGVGQDVYCGVVLSVAADPGTTVDATVTPFLQPWNWSVLAVSIWEMNPDGSNPTELSNLQIVPPTGFTLDAGILTQIQNDFGTNKGNDFCWTDPQTVDPAKPGGGTSVNSSGARYPWPAHLAQVARYPYPIPHLLNLAFIVKVGLQASAQPFNPAPNKSYAVAITFKASSAPGAKTYTPAPTAFVPDKGQRVTIPFDSGSIVTLTQLLPGAIAIGAVASQIVPLDVPETSDWQAHLVPGVGDLYDLSSLLIRPVRAACDHIHDPDPDVATFKSSIAGDFGNFCRATVNAQRNILSYGGGVAPDNTSLLQQVSNIWIGNASSPTAIAMEKFASDFAKAIGDAKKKDTDATWQALLAKNVELHANPLVQSPPKSVDALHLSDKLMPLEHLQLRFTQNELIVQLLLAQWDFVYQTYSAQYPSFQAQYQNFRSSATTILTTLNLRGILQRGNLENDWPAIVASASKIDKKTLSKNIQTQLSTKLAGRFPAGSFPATDSIAAALIKDADSWLAKQLELLVPISQNALPTRTSEGISLVVDTLDAGMGQNDVTDTLRSMIGYCVLMRDTTPSFDHAWRCLNVAFLKTGDPSQFTDAVKNLNDPVVVAVPQHTQDQMRRAILTYNNQPLMVESPAHAFGQDLMQQDPNAERLISFQHPSVTATLDASNPKWKVPGLVFGNTYEFKIGRVRNCGVLPATFSASTNPALLDLGAVEKNYAGPATPSIRCQRTVPVGDLRFAVNGLGTLASSLRKLALPTIPPDVQPRARELYPAPSTDDPASAQPPVPPQPLILLTSYKTEFPQATPNFTLQIQKPTTDLQTWDRWMAASPTNMQQRIDLWTNFHRLARQQKTNSDLAIDDPAVQQLQITLDINDPGLAPVSVPKKGDPAIIATWPSPAAAPAPPTSVANSAGPLLLKIVAASPSKSTFDASTWTLTLAEGAVVKITIAPVVAQGSSLFATGISQGASYDFLVEAANLAMPTSDALRAAFIVSSPTDPTYNSVDFALPLTPSSVIGDQIRSATIRTQVWRWDGRPLSLFKFGKDLVTPDPSILEWEVAAFATRQATDSTVRPMNLVTVPPIAPGKPETLALVAKDDITGQLGSLYYRSGVQVDNRYGSLVPKANRSVSTLGDTSTLPGANGGWHRTVVPCRLPNTTLPKPAIKFILPLTGVLPAITPAVKGQPAKNGHPATPDQPRTYNAQAPAASALVVVQGPWYALGGLAEDLEVSIFGSGEGASVLGVPEVGPDPIIWHGKRSDFPGSYATYSQDKDGKPTDGSEFATADKRLHGPVGHTFDDSDTNPLWVNTTFILDPPPPVHADAQPWTFAKVAFRRAIHKEGWLPAPPSKKDFRSEWTDPQWVQFLPSQFTGLGKAVDLSKCSVNVDPSKKIASISDQTGAPLTLSDDTGDAHMMFAFLLTEQVPDLLGRKGQERYFQVCVRRTDGTHASWSFDKTADGQSPFVGRVLAIQMNPVPSAAAITNEDLLWGALFPQSDTTAVLNSDAMARIVAVSPPIFSNVLTCSIA